jgi:hypothetical protein
VADAIVVIYLAGWLVTSAALAASSRLLTRRFRPVRYPVALSFAAGGAWLLLLVGAAQFGALLVLWKVFADDEADPAADAEQVAGPADELV